MPENPVLGCVNFENSLLASVAGKFRVNWWFTSGHEVGSYGMHSRY